MHRIFRPIRWLGGGLLVAAATTALADESGDSALFRIARYVPEGNGCVLSNIRIEATIGSLSSGLPTYQVRASVHHLGSDIGGYRYNGEIYTSYTELRNGKEITRDITDMSQCRLRVGGSIFAWTSIEEFSNKTALGAIPTLVWYDDVKSELGQHNFRFTSIWIDSTALAETEHWIEKMLKRQREEEKKTKAEAEDPEEDSTGDEYDDFWSGESEEPEEDAASVDDFWAGGDLGDAAGKESSDGGDFWTGADTVTAMNTKDEADDFWSGAKAAGSDNGASSFEIVKRLNRGTGSVEHGVVDAAGRVLIPFREWTIESYIGGVAEVTKPDTRVFGLMAADDGPYESTLRSSACELERWTMDITETKIEHGYVDSSGKWVSGPEHRLEVEISPQWTSMCINCYAPYYRKERPAVRRCVEALERRARSRSLPPNVERKVTVPRW